MKIGELAQRSGLTPSRIRFYEEKGLLGNVVRQANGYRRYPAEALLFLNIITSAQQAGFTLQEILEVMPVESSNWEHEQLIGVLRRKMDEIEAIEKRMAQNRLQLQLLIQSIQESPEGMNCTANAGRVMEEVVQKMTLHSKDSA